LIRGPSDFTGGVGTQGGNSLDRTASVQRRRAPKRPSGHAGEPT
jgi:hypothetical protein